MPAMRGVTRGVSGEADRDFLERPDETQELANRNARTAAPAAVILVDADLQALCLNAEAIRVLRSPGWPAAAREGWQAVRTQVLSDSRHDLSHASTNFRSFVTSGRRYRCRVFPLEVPRSRLGAPAAVVVIERDQPSWFPTAEALAHFHLTAREEQAVRFALSNLTNRQIAVEMGISPNTVKALLRLAMTKIGVSSRMGILHKLSPSPDAGGVVEIEFAEPSVEPASARRASTRKARRNSSRAAAHSSVPESEYWPADRRRASSLVPGGHA
jgi:DNA-binding CsgD family transcriptional regulator